MDETKEIIKLSNVTVSRNEIVMLDNVSLAVHKGEFTAIIGPNGAGKTTLLKVALGILKPNSGSIEVFGRKLSDLGPLRSKIGYVPQIFDIDLNFPVTVFEVVLMGTYGKLGLGKRPGPIEKAAAMAALEKVGIVELKDRPIRRLSSGQRQRTLIARALANSPELLILDEPTTGVDAETTFNLYTLLRDLKAEGVTIVLVSHDVGVVAGYLDRIACLNRSLVLHCRPDEAVCSNTLASVYGMHAAFLHHGGMPHIVVEDHND